VKVAYVTVRYGPSIVGGAEQACRQLAEHLAADGVDVEVYTTCATDPTTWADELPAGTSVEAGVTVHRHRSTSVRSRRFEAFSAEVLADPGHQSPESESRWLGLQGPVCPDAVDAALDSGAALIVATPYLYWPTVETASRAGARLVLHPAAHDEAPIRMAMFGRAFAAASGLAFYTDAERRLLGRLWPGIAASHQLVVGLGVDPGIGSGADPATFRASASLDDRPYLLCLGRVDDGKGARALGRFFAAFKRRHPGPLALVFAGPVVHPPDPHPDVLVTGVLSEQDKWSALAGCEALVSPSANESFSIVLLEAWVSGRPALVNARCGPTSEHARRSGGGLAFDGYAAFETALVRVLGDPGLARAMGDAGRSYVEGSFTWPVVTTRYHRWLQGLAGRDSTNLVRP